MKHKLKLIALAVTALSSASAMAADSHATTTVTYSYTVDTGCSITADKSGTLESGTEVNLTVGSGPDSATVSWDYATQDPNLDPEKTYISFNHIKTSKDAAFNVPTVGTAFPFKAVLTPLSTATKGTYSDDITITATCTAS